MKNIKVAKAIMIVLSNLFCMISIFFGMCVVGAVNVQLHEYPKVGLAILICVVSGLVSHQFSVIAKLIHE